MAVKKKKSVKVLPPKKVKAPKAVKAIPQDYYFVVLSWSNGQGSSGVLSDVHKQDKGSTFNIFGVQRAASNYLEQLAGPGSVAVLTNFFSITKAESELYSEEFDKDQIVKRANAEKAKAEFLAAREAKKIADEAAACNAEPECVPATELESEDDSDNILPLHLDTPAEEVSEVLEEQV